MLAMAIGSILLLGSARFLPALQREIWHNTRQLSLEDEIWQRTYTVAKHLQRAGYCHGHCTGEGLHLAEQGQCVIVQWDGNNNGVWDTIPAKEADQTGFRMKDNVLETLRGATSCQGKGWEKMTDPNTVLITAFTVERRDITGFSPVLMLHLRGASKAEMLHLRGASKAAQRQALVQSALEWGRGQLWSGVTEMECRRYSSSGARVCLRRLSGDEVVMAAQDDGMTLWRLGNVIQGSIVFSPHGWSDFCPLKEVALCRIP
ncbi:Prepilin peptidase dependent protein B [Salmonella enterica subsp. enterica serovar Montevideo str. S5-403]|uniref:Prepilin peptidase dependent protein B n=2 Tax=Salmonella enterica I TaxID=59201 RepID=G5Q7B6_SALMO|nr:Prepilin peptidase dependent protein B [Salmonella enterica subsp. enterica serovar Montevideo str. S5-403]